MDLKFENLYEKARSHIKSTKYYRVSGTCLVCAIVLDNGYTVIGESACIEPALFNEDARQQLAYNDAIAKLVEIFAFTARQESFEYTQIDKSLKARTQEEKDRLDEKLAELQVALHFNDYDLDSNHKALVELQLQIMQNYSDVLAQRLALMGD